MAPGNYYRTLLLLAALACAPAPAGCVASQSAPRTVWDRIMEEQSALNLKRGYSLMQEEKYPAAADEFYKAAQRDPSSPWPHLLYGSALYWLGEPEKALDEFEAAMKLDPKNSMAYQLRGIVRARAGQLQEALDDFLAAERYDRTRADVKMNAGSVYAALGDRGRALDYFRAAVACDPESPLYRFQLGLFYSRTARYAEAGEQLQKAVDIFPEYEDALLELAAVRERDGRLSEAIKLYRRALAEKPRDSVARFRLAWALRKAGRAAEAAKVLDGVFLLAPVNEKGGISMALAYSGRQPAPPAEGAAPQGPLYSALAKVPPEQPARVTVELLETPKAALQEAPQGEKLAGRLRSAFSRPKVSYTRREYLLPASSPEERRRRAAEISAEADKLLKGVSPGSDARMNFNIDTSAPPAEGKPAGNKALYRPRDVGNDMGLWVMGDNWLDNVAEALDEMDDAKDPDAGLRLLTGLGYLLLGEPSSALEEFSGGGAQAALGRAAARVESGDEAKALEECKAALKLEPANKTALANKAWLEAK